MREYKFRGKRRSDGEWLYGDLVHRGSSTYIFPPDGLGSADNYEVDPATVGAYVGLKDKNGRDIYEGDIATERMGFGTSGKHPRAKGPFVVCPGVVDRLPNGRYYLSDALNKDERRRLIAGNKTDWYRRFLDWYVWKGEWPIEVIGNRFDTPSLLGGEPDEA